MPSNASPRFSVVIPTYNRAAAVRRAVESALRQTYQVHEILVVDDGSTDDTESVIRGLADPRIKHLKQMNSGANTARNRGIDAATGTHVAFLDSDDEFVPEHLSRVATALQANSEVIVYARAEIVRGPGLRLVKPARAIRSDEPMGDYLARHRGWVPPSTLVVPLHTAKTVRWLEGLRYGQDTDFALRLAAAGPTFIMLPHPSAIYSDVEDASRVSTAARGDDRIRWTDQSRPLLTNKAYYAFRGWAAKPYARAGRHWRALALYTSAVLHGAWSIRESVRIGIQIFVPPRLYRMAANIVVKLRTTPQ